MRAPSPVPANAVAAGARHQDTAALIPDWITPVSTTLGIISLIAAIAIVVLLLLPPSNPYFRKQEPVWTPPSYPAP